MRKLAWIATLALMPLGVIGACGGDDSTIPDGGDATTSDVKTDVVTVDAPFDAAEAAATTPPLPTLQAGNHLKLWFSADFGVTCSNGRVTAWNDLSGTKFDGGAAVAMPFANALGPQCDVANHTVNGVNVPFFARSPEDAGTYLDETLSISELSSVLDNSSYTIYVVDRRWSDFLAADGGPGASGNFVLGTGIADAACGASVQNTALELGYVYYNGTAQFDLDQTCNSGQVATTPVPSTPPVATSFEMVRYGAADGGTPRHEFWLGGVLSGTGILGANFGCAPDTCPLTNTSGGAIGRASLDTTEARFDGDIVEILVFDTFIIDADRTAMDAYIKKHWNL